MIEKDFQLSATEVRLKLSDLAEQRSKLNESRSRFTRVLGKFEAELAYNNEDLGDKNNRLQRIEKDYRPARVNRAKTLQDIRIKWRRFFRPTGRENPDATDHLGPESLRIVLSESLPGLSSAHNGPTLRTEPTNGTAAVAGRPDGVTRPKHDESFEIERRTGTVRLPANH
ncbi:hypothetical protein FOMG_17743 [Fusarium oxysporum f. sp. melonis 26406]|uniref:Uncharacterized protein n=2 Tax=Fusarium oxysporum TaxID=5507 RepID=A0A2H3FR68_FUSOX|nr:hypothetical protein FOMG_17743 [Fusarium oxysporum f. sp. melonis 26406]PCD21937.1 hypothetical protein AU210_015740 [Fusarium oxysporum f. sp. radicis-cucumerinum]